MRQPGNPGRTTLALGVLLALLLGVGAWVDLRRPLPPVPRSALAPAPPAPSSPLPTPSASPRGPGSTSQADGPRQGRAYPVRTLGPLAGRSLVASGRGNADLRYRRAPANGTRVHLTCTGCDADTWLVEGSRGGPVGGGPLASPADTTVAFDTADPRPATSLLVKAPRRAEWLVILTPFDALPVHEQTFDALDDDVLAVRARRDLRVRCPGPGSVSTLSRPRGAAEYGAERREEQDASGAFAVRAARGTDELVLVVRCAGRWTVTVP